MSSKKLKTINNSYFSGYTTESDLSESLSKEIILNLIKQNDPSIGYELIVSKSDYMKNFNRVLKDCIQTDFIKCINCSAIIKCNSIVGYGGPKRHKCIGNTLQLSQSFDEHFYKLAENELNVNSELTDALVMFIAKDMRPMDVIKGEGFRQLAQHFIDMGSKNPNIALDNILPSDTCLANHMKSMYEIIKAKLIDCILNVDSFGITCDHWTHDVTKFNYISLTIQYINECEVKARVLATIQTTNKTALITKSDVNSVLTDFKLSQKEIYFTTDNSSSTILAFSNHNWISCTAHNINILHKNSFKTLKQKFSSNKIIETLKIAKQLVTYFKQSCIQYEFETKLKQSISIRWDSKYLMLDSINKNLNQIKNISITNRMVNELVMKIDESVLCELIVFLKPFYELRLNLCKDSSPTLHLVLPTKQKMILLTEPSVSDSEVLKTLKEIYKQNIDKYIKVSDLHIMSTVLYPPLRELKNLLPFEEKIRIHSEMANILNDITISETNVYEEKPNNDVDLCLQDFIGLNHSLDNNSMSELEDYILYSVNFDINCCLLLFWEQNKCRFPRLYKLANRLLSIPATNLSAEQNFSAEGLTPTDIRSNLSPNNVDHLLFIKSNFDLY